MMIRKLSTLKTCVAAIFAIGALAAPGAHAAEFHSTAEHTILSGSQVGSVVFTVGAGFGSVTCEKATVSGTMTNKTETSQTLTPTFTGCKDSFGRIVDTDGNYTITETAPASSTGGNIVHFQGEQTTTITSNGVVVCTITQLTQTFPETISHKGSLGRRVLTWLLGEIDTTTSGGFFNCGVSNGAHSAGTSTGEFLITGTNTAGGSAEIWVE